MARPGAVRRPGFWTPTGVTDSREFAEAMARLLGEDPDTEARAVSAYDLMHKIPSRIATRTSSGWTAVPPPRSTAPARFSGQPRWLSRPRAITVPATTAVTRSRHPDSAPDEASSPRPPTRTERAQILLSSVNHLN